MGLAGGQGFSAFVLAGMLTVGGGAVAIVMQYGKGGQEAIARAQSQYGDGYHYVVVESSGVNSMHHYGLVAYNDREIREVSVEWDALKK